jgi:serine/threonine protein kinase
LLTKGTRLGPYEIIEAVGAGGMGEVYKARDTRLDRNVAVKVLPAHVSAHDDLKQRFEREAKIISNLSHPHICALHDVGREEGVDFLVMEFLEGETLGDRVKKGALAAEEVLRFGIQIAEALDKAHRNGVVHRDLKPGNIVLTRDGLKLLDFGLAKSADTATASGSASLSAMKTSAADQAPLTEKGTVLGTFQYMAPEQLEGKEADPRTDIFALGVVLYEMATGKRPFEGDSQASLIAAIMSKTPRPMTEFSAVTPPLLEALVRGCVAKDPDDRVQTAHDVKLQLTWIAEGSGLDAPGLAVQGAKRSRGLAGIMAVLFGVLSLVLIVRAVLNRPEPDRSVSRLSVVIPSHVRAENAPPEHAISPDGRSIAFVGLDTTGTVRLWLRPFDNLDVEELPGTEGASLPFWSPDSRSVGFFVDGKLKRCVIAGDRSVQTICDVVSGRGGTWGADGTILFNPASAGPLFRVAATGGTPVQVTALDSANGETAHRFPQFLPDGNHFIYVSLPARDGRFDVRLASLEDPEPRTLVRADGAAVFAPPGYLVFERNEALIAQRLDMKRLEMSGDPFTLSDRPGGDRDYNGSPAVSASANGMLSYVHGQVDQAVVEWFDRTGTSRGRLPVPRAAYRAIRISPDGRRVAIAKGDPTNVSDIWVLEIDRGVSTRLTFEPLRNGSPVWVPDGSRIIFGSLRDGTRNLYWKAANGAGLDELLARLPGIFANPMDVSPDGKSLLVRLLLEETDEDIYVMSLLGDDPPRPFLNTRFAEQDGKFSPNGRWVAYRSNESGRLELYVQSFPEPRTKVRVSTSGAGPSFTFWTQPIWSKDGKELLYVGGDGLTIMSVPVETEPTFRAGTPRALFRLPREYVGFDSRYGQMFLVVHRGEEHGLSLTVVRNWTAQATEH